MNKRRGRDFLRFTRRWFATMVPLASCNGFLTSKSLFEKCLGKSKAFKSGSSLWQNCHISVALCPWTATKSGRMSNQRHSSALVNNNPLIRQLRLKSFHRYASLPETVPNLAIECEFSVQAKRFSGFIPAAFDCGTILSAPRILKYRSNRCRCRLRAARTRPGPRPILGWSA